MQHPTSYLSPVHNLNLLLFMFPISILPPSSLNQFSQPTLLTSRRTDHDPSISQPRPDVIFHLRHSILPLSTSFAPRNLHIYWHPIMRCNVICMYDLHQASIVVSHQSLGIATNVLPPTPLGIASLATPPALITKHIWLKDLHATNFCFNHIHLSSIQTNLC